MAVGVLRALSAEDKTWWRPIGNTGMLWPAGISARAIMAEMFGRSGGCCRGRGGSMHLFDAATRFYGGNAIVGGGLPLAVGLALADQDAGRPNA